MATRKAKMSQSNQDEDDFEIDDSIYRKIESSISEKEQKATDNRMLLAKKIVTAMKAKGWKQIDLSKALGDKDTSIISRWLSGTHTFTTETLWKISDVLNVELISLGKKDSAFNEEIEKLTKNLNIKDDIINDLYGEIYEKEMRINILKRELAIVRDRMHISVLSTGYKSENFNIKEQDFQLS